MRTLLRHIVSPSLLAILSLAASCTKGFLDHYDNEICDYTVRLRYDYNEENRSPVNLIERYVTSIDEYIFDEQGILYAVNRVVPDPCGEGMISDLDLPPGRYSVIGVGNVDTRSLISDNGTMPVPGVTHRHDMLMDLLNALQHGDGTIGPSERLYHGYRTFSVAQGEVSRVRVDMVHSHKVLRIRVTWRHAAPEDETDVVMTLSDITPRYSLMPSHAHIDFVGQIHDPHRHDHYPIVDHSVRHHIPFVHEQVTERHTYRADSYINASKTIHVEFVSYRVRNSGGSVVRLRGASGPLMNDVDLMRWFGDNGIELDLNLRQEFALEFVIERDKSVSVHALDLADWFEGGTIH